MLDALHDYELVDLYNIVHFLYDAPSKLVNDMQLVCGRGHLLFSHWGSIPPSHQTLFTGASADGWGAMLVEQTGEVSIAGAPWERGYRYEVNALETHAVALAVSAFRHRWLRSLILPTLSPRTTPRILLAGESPPCGCDRARGGQAVAKPFPPASLIGIEYDLLLIHLNWLKNDPKELCQSDKEV
jgi:hypothetical protein